MAPHYSTRDFLPGTQAHAKSTYYSDSTRHRRSSGSPLLVSSSIRAASSPRLVHGDSPLLNAVTPSSEDVEAFPSPGQFSDAEVEEWPTSPSSKALQDQLLSATKALEELKEAVRRRRINRFSRGSKDLAAEARACIGREEDCLHSAAGLGLGLLMDDLQSKLTRPTTHELSVPHQDPSPQRELPEAPARRHWLAEEGAKDCDTPAATKKWPPSPAHDKQIFSPQTVVASPTIMTSAPPTPSLESGVFSTAVTPVMPSSTFTASNTTQQQGQQGQNQSTSFASHQSNHATAIASVGAAGAFLILAALLIAVCFRKGRSKRHKSEMESVLDKVAPLPDGGDKEKRESAAIGSNDGFPAASQKGSAAPVIPECRTVPPWLSLNMGTHPFASATIKAERYSHDLVDSGLVGQQQPVKDYSFNWNFPKLSVPPAAARAISTGHYVKKRATVIPSAASNQQVKPISESSSSTTRRCSSVRDNMSQSASSECVDPEIDHRRKSFAILEASSKPLVWIKSALRHLTPTQQHNEQQSGRDVGSFDDSSISSPWIPSLSSRRSVSQSSEDRSLSLTMQKSTTSFTQFVPDSMAITQAVVQQVMEIRLPSLSIANSPMLDVKDAPSPIASSKQASRISSLNWSNDKTPPQRSFSSGSDGSSAPQPKRGSGGIRRVSWAGPLEACREDSKESVLRLSRSPESTASKTNNIRRSQAWNNANSDMTDTDDETREGYEAEEEEMETEAELDHNYLTSTPVITLTCSEEEGRFERQISLNSVYREATSSDDHSMLEKRERAATTAKLMTSSDDCDDDTDEDDAATIIVHSSGSGSAEDNTSETDSCRSGALHSLLVDDFPTIPEWTPIAGSPRSPHQ